MNSIPIPGPFYKSTSDACCACNPNGPGLCKWGIHNKCKLPREEARLVRDWSSIEYRRPPVGALNTQHACMHCCRRWLYAIAQICRLPARPTPQVLSASPNLNCETGRSELRNTQSNSSTDHKNNRYKAEPGELLYQGQQISHWALKWEIDRSMKSDMKQGSSVYRKKTVN